LKKITTWQNFFYFWKLEFKIYKKKMKKLLLLLAAVVCITSDGFGSGQGRLGDHAAY